MENTKNNIFNIDNYNKKLQLNTDIIIHMYKEIINEYLFHAIENIIIQDQKYFIFVLKPPTLKKIFFLIPAQAE